MVLIPNTDEILHLKNCFFLKIWFDVIDYLFSTSSIVESTFSYYFDVFLFVHISYNIILTLCYNPTTLVEENKIKAIDSQQILQSTQFLRIQKISFSYEVFWDHLRQTQQWHK